MPFERWTLAKKIANAMVNSKDYCLWEIRIRERLKEAKGVLEHKNYRRLPAKVKVQVNHMISVLNAGGVDNEEIDRMHHEIVDIENMEETMDIKSVLDVVKETSERVAQKIRKKMQGR